MNQELEQKLVTAHPSLFQFYRKKSTPPLAINYGIECTDGWFKLIKNTLEAIDREVDLYPETSKKDFAISQIKTKFGTLRIYMTHSDDIMEEIISNAGNLSKLICEHCGEPKGVTRNTEGFVKSLCVECMKEYAERDYRLNGEL